MAQFADHARRCSFVLGQMPVPGWSGLAYFQLRIEDRLSFGLSSGEFSFDPPPGGRAHEENERQEEPNLKPSQSQAHSAKSDALGGSKDNPLRFLIPSTTLCSRDWGTGDHRANSNPQNARPCV